MRDWAITRRWRLAKVLVGVESQQLSLQFVIQLLALLPLMISRSSILHCSGSMLWSFAANSQHDFTVVVGRAMHKLANCAG
jgi:hypothetical protein